MTINGNSGSLTRRALLGAFAATTLTAAPTLSNAAGILRGAGDIRRIRMFSGRTGERIDMIYWIEGKYVKDALKEVDYFMRDWRTGGVKSIDLRTIDVMAAAHNLMDANEPYMLLSGYRSPNTNAMLRSRLKALLKIHYICAEKLLIYVCPPALLAKWPVQHLHVVVVVLAVILALISSTWIAALSAHGEADLLNWDHEDTNGSAF